MEPLVNLLMGRFGFSRPSAEAYAKRYLENYGAGSVPTYVADDVPRQVFNISNDARKAVVASDANKDQVAQQLIPGPPPPRPQAPGIGPTPGVQAFNQGRDKIYNEYNQPGMQNDLRTASINHNLFYAFKNPYPENQPSGEESARQDWKSARAIRDQRAEIDAMFKEYEKAKK